MCRCRRACVAPCRSAARRSPSSRASAPSGRSTAGGAVSRIDPRTARITRADLQPGRRRPTTSGSAPARSGRSTTAAARSSDRSGAAQGGRADPGRGRAGRPRLPRRTAWVINHRDLGLVADRDRDEPGPAAHDGARRCARADGVGVRVALGDRPRHRPASARSGDGRRAGDDRDRRGRNRRRGGRPALWVPARAAAADPRGFPTMTALRRVDPATGKVTTPARAISARRRARARPVPTRRPVRGQHRRPPLRGAGLGAAAGAASSSPSAASSARAGARARPSSASSRRAGARPSAPAGAARRAARRRARGSAAGSARPARPRAASVPALPARAVSGRP